MYAVTRLFGFCYGHRLLDYAGKCRHLHGHNGLVEVTIRKRSLDKLGMVVDLEEVKALVQRWVDETLDHKLILNARDPLLAALRAAEQPIVTLPANPTAEAIARLIFEHAKSERLPVASVRVWETPSSNASYGIPV